MNYVLRVLIFITCWTVLLCNIGLVYQVCTQSLTWSAITPIILALDILVVKKAIEDW